MPPDVENPAIVETPVVQAAPAVEAVAAPAAPAETPVVAPEAAPVETAPAEKTEPHPTEVVSLLEEAGKKPEVEAAKPDAEKPVETPPVETPAAVEWDFKFPETIKADDAVLGRFKENLEGLLKPKEGETPSSAANRLLDMHAEAMANHDKSLRDEQVRVWNETRKNWRNEAMADPRIGGAGHQTAMGAIARVRDALVSDHNPDKSATAKAGYDKDVREFNDFLRITGAGDHPAFLKFLHRAARYTDEPSMITARASPPPNAGKKPGRSLYSE